jgi:potassium-transporting ATPase KdpC subunit
MPTLVLALRVSIVTLVLTCLVYPLAVTTIAQVLFPAAASGSIVRDEKGRPIGSELIAQPFTWPDYFQPRPSAAGNGYDAANSSGSNLGPTSAKLRDRAAADVKRLALENKDASGPVPAELVTASASGLDPHISPAAVLWQLPRVAKARGITPDRIRPVIEAHIEGRDLGFLGEPRVNVLLLNIAIDEQFGKPARSRFGSPARE